jgi:hypothetical protein
MLHKNILKTVKIMTGFVVFLLIFGGCANKGATKSLPYKGVFKTKKFKFNDTLFLYKAQNYIKMEAYAMGQPAYEIEVENQVCVKDEGCMSKTRFNEEFLHPDYDSDLFIQVLNAQPIYNGKGKKEREAGGFIQILKSKTFHIVYRVSGDNIFFKDIDNKIIIKLTKIKS